MANVDALKSAARAAIVMPAVFAFSDLAARFSGALGWLVREAGAAQRILGVHG